MGIHLSSEGIGFQGGFETDQVDRDLDEAAQREARKIFPYEFLNRFDELITYQTLKEDHLYRILENLVSNLHIRSIDCTEPFLLQLQQSAKDELVRVGTDPKFGARPLQRALEAHLVTPLSHLICSGQIRRGDLVTVEYSDGEFLFEKEAGSMTAAEIAQFEALHEQRERSRDLDGIDDGGEANRIVDEVHDVSAESDRYLQTTHGFDD